METLNSIDLVSGERSGSADSVSRGREKILTTKC